MYKSDEALKQSIDQWIEANQNDFVKDLAKLVAIPSISVENDGPWPFGEECKNVLDKAAEIAGEYGFTVVNHEYHCGSCVVPASIRSESECLPTWMLFRLETDGSIRRWVAP